MTSPARRCEVPGGVVEPRLGPWDLGEWRGRPLSDLDPEALAQWRADPTFDGHRGETLLSLANRVGDLLDDWRAEVEPAGAGVHLVGVTHAAVIKVAVAVVLRAPLTSVWDIDVHPSSSTRLHPQPTGWRVVSVNRRSTRET